jgi:hypothetical protein
MIPVVDLASNRTVQLVSLHDESALLLDNGRLYYQVLKSIQFLSTYPAPGGSVGTPVSSVRTSVEPLGQPILARQLPAGSTSANTALTPTCRRASMLARDADIRYAIGSTAQTANASTSHLIPKGERLDVELPVSPNIAVIRAGGVDGTLEVSELS